MSEPNPALERTRGAAFPLRVAFRRAPLSSNVMPHPERPPYDDAYSTCAETYATLRVFSDSVRPDTVADALGTEATSSFQKGDSYGNKHHRKTNGWFYETRHPNTSRDNGRHVDLLLELLEGKIEVLERLRGQGCEIDIVSYWLSNGQGGPQLWPEQMLKLGRLGIPIWWDIYFAGNDGA